MTQDSIFPDPGALNEAIEETEIFAPKFSLDGLIPVVATDAASGRVLMLAYMNKEALQLTIETGEACYWSRSRGELWRKGATSGNTQLVKEIRTDCDQDAIELVVEQTGPACHTDRKLCFYRRIKTNDSSVSLQFST